MNIETRIYIQSDIPILVRCVAPPHRLEDAPTKYYNSETSPYYGKYGNLTVDKIKQNECQLR